MSQRTDAALTGSSMPSPSAGAPVAAHLRSSAPSQPRLRLVCAANPLPCRQQCQELSPVVLHSALVGVSPYCPAVLIRDRLPRGHENAQTRRRPPCPEYSLCENASAAQGIPKQ